MGDTQQNLSFAARNEAAVEGSPTTELTTGKGRCGSLNFIAIMGKGKEVTDSFFVEHLAGANPNTNFLGLALKPWSEVYEEIICLFLCY